MKIIIVSYGKVRTALTEQLNREHHDIILTDSGGEVLQAVANNIDIIRVTGNGAVYQVQMETGIKEADLLIATINFNKLNMLCCLIAKKAGNCHIIARTRNPEYSAEINYIREELNLSLAINPELAAVREVARLLRFPSAIRIEPSAKGRTELPKFQVPKGPCPDQMRVLEVASKLKSNVLIYAVERGEDVAILDGNFIILGRGKVSFIAPHPDPVKFFREADIGNNTVNSAMFVDRGRLMVYLVKVLIGARIKIKIIERDEERCRLLNGLLPEAMIVHGDGSDQQLLLKERICQTEAPVSLTGFDEENIMFSLYVASQSRAKLITKVSRIVFGNMINSLNLGSVIYPEMLTADIILQYVRTMQNSMGSNIETLYKIVTDKAEALEFRIREHSPAVGIPLETLRLKSNLLVACISRNSRFITPRGRGVVQIGDLIIIVTTYTGLNDLKDISG